MDLKTFYIPNTQIDVNHPNFYSPYATGKLLRIDSFSNYTGSIQVYISGDNVKLCDFTTGSDTNKWEHFPFNNQTGSFVINGPIRLVVSGILSGTSTTIGPIQIIYE